MPCGVRGCTTSGRYVRILDLREGNEESSEEITGCKASVYAEFDDCPRVGKFVKLLDFRHFERHMMFSQSDRKTYKKAISDGVSVSVVLMWGVETHKSTINILKLFNRIRSVKDRSFSSNWR